MEDADGVLLTYVGDGDGTGRLTVYASFDGFSGVGAAYFGDDQLLRFADNRIRKEGPDAVLRSTTESNAVSIDGLTGFDPLV